MLLIHLELISLSLIKNIYFIPVIVNSKFFQIKLYNTEFLPILTFIDFDIYLNHYF